MLIQFNGIAHNQITPLLHYQYNMDRQSYQHNIQMEQFQVLRPDMVVALQNAFRDKGIAQTYSQMINMLRGLDDQQLKKSALNSLMKCEFQLQKVKLDKNFTKLFINYSMNLKRFNQIIFNIHEVKLDKKDLVIIFGNTGAGKSTLINWLLDFKPIYDKKTLAYTFKQQLSAKVKLNQSCTQIPKLYNLDQYNLVLVDTPGFLDTRSFQDRLRNQIQIYKVIQYAQKVRSIILVNQSTIMQARFISLKNLIDKIIKFMKKSQEDIFQFQFTFVINKILNKQFVISKWDQFKQFALKQWKIKINYEPIFLQYMLDKQDKSKVVEAFKNSLDLKKFYDSSTVKLDMQTQKYNSDQFKTIEKVWSFCFQNIAKLAIDKKCKVKQKLQVLTEIFKILQQNQNIKFQSLLQFIDEDLGILGILGKFIGQTDFELVFLKNIIKQAQDYLKTLLSLKQSTLSEGLKLDNKFMIMIMQRKSQIEKQLIADLHLNQYNIIIDLYKKLQGNKKQLNNLRGQIEKYQKQKGIKTGIKFQKSESQIQNVQLFEKYINKLIFKIELLKMNCNKLDYVIKSQNQEQKFDSKGISHLISVAEEHRFPQLKQIISQINKIDQEFNIQIKQAKEIIKQILDQITQFTQLIILEQKKHNEWKNSDQNLSIKSVLSGVIGVGVCLTPRLINLGSAPFGAAFLAASLTYSRYKHNNSIWHKNQIKKLQKIKFRCFWKINKVQ